MCKHEFNQVHIFTIQTEKVYPGSNINITWMKPEKISTKLGVDLYNRAKTQTITTGLRICGKDLDFSPAI